VQTLSCNGITLALSCCCNERRIEIPENVSASLRSRWKDVPRRVLEAVAAEAYRSGALTAHQVGELLGHGSRWETESFLKQAQAYLHYGEDDLERDLAALCAARG
jgi:hypothetical protein